MLNPAHMTYGTDPEGFFKQNGEIIGSERIIPKPGIESNYRFVVVRDGVQFELQPTPQTTIAHLITNLSTCFQRLNQELVKHPNVSICFDGLVEVSREELDALSKESRVLGCAPSMNIYNAPPINVDPVEYRKRSAGGHLHLGLSAPIYNLYSEGMDNRIRVMPFLDIFVGNTCVLLDRDPGAAERRQNYGRAGEFRLPRHGLEYRTLSNFWLRDPALMEFVFGMASFSVACAQGAISGYDVEATLINKYGVKIKDYRKAINTNNFKLALANFKRIVPFILTHVQYLPDMPLRTKEQIEQFITIAENINKNGIETLFPTENIVSKWVSGKYTKFNEYLGK